nr:immunoglobulin heavy chain junction region [Macaca mulatta]
CARNRGVLLPYFDFW